MLTFTEPKTGRTQQVGENESVRIKTLKRLGWKQTTGTQETAPADDEATVTVAQELEPDEAGDAVLSVTEIPVEGDKDVTLALPDPDDTQELPAEKPASKSKGR